MMNKIKIAALLFVGFCFNATAQDLPQPSPGATVTQKVGLTDVTMDYSRPGIKGRQIFGGLEAYGEVWRTGANSATKITLSTDANVGGVDVKAGTYSILSIPGEKEWKVMLNSDLKVTENSYKAENDVATITLPAMKCETRESMMFSFDDVTSETANLIFEWENAKWVMPIKVNSKEAAMANIKDKISEVENAYGVYNSSARYYLDAGLDIDQALTWSKKSVAISAKFWNVYTLSLIYEKKGDKKMAIETAKKSMKLAEEASYQPYVKMNAENIAKWSK